jgi:oligosaccharide repeat unit polymerase
MRSWIRLFCGSPARLMLTAWAACGLFYVVGPIRYDVVPSPTTVGFILLGLLSFVVGTWCAPAPRRPEGLPVAPADEPVATTTLQRIAVVCAVLGLIGAAAMTADKVLLSGIDYSQGIALARIERMVQTMYGVSEPARSPLLYLGHLTACFGIVGFLLYLLRGDRFAPLAVILACLGIMSSAALALLYGGRSPLVFVVTLAIGAVIVRVITHRPWLPREKLGRVLLLLIVLGAVAYNVYVIRQRTELSGMREYEEFAAQLGFYGAEPSPLAASLRDSLSQDMLVDGLSTAFYFTHGFTMLERSLSYDTLGPYLGRYQFALVGIVLGRLAPGLAPDDAMDEEMDAAGVYGVFSTMWGGMYVDFGTAGALVAIFVCGWLAGLAHKRAVQTDSLSAQLIECYVLAGIVTSPVISVFLPYITLPALASILVGASAVSWAGARHRQATGRERAVPAAPITAAEQTEVGAAAAG